ncbi:MAG: peptidoglycan DD-metalloendopeptidase family protein [Cyclobacteriaceae bacterium]|nr:peptidoglycan DD-metalloendopeptidase family protein [Cyclobacteriaceae bacterium]
MAVPIQTLRTAEVPETFRFPLGQTAGWICLAITLWLVGRSGFHLYLLRKLKNQCVRVCTCWYSLYRTGFAQPFSFFSHVFIPGRLFDTDAFDRILAHECVHVRRRHSWDRLLTDVFVALFWFNPFIYLYRKALIEVHEYEADEAVIRQFDDPVIYQEILFRQLQAIPYSGLVSHFNFSTLKKRIVMMNKLQNGRSSRLVYLLIMPLVAWVTIAFTSVRENESVVRMTNKIGSLTTVVEPTQFVPLQDVRDVPSIFPVKADGKPVRVTSGYGMRMHPVEKVERMHMGIDISAATGTPVIATADGVVEVAEYLPHTYGNMLLIRHGDTYKTRYAQLDDYVVKAGDPVRQGQVIGHVGSSGKSTAPHLHYEVQKDNRNVDPKDYIGDYTFSQVPDAPKADKKSREEIQEQQNPDSARNGQELMAARQAELESQQAEFDKQQAEFEKQQAEFEKQQAEFEKQQAEFESQQAEFGKQQLKDIQEQKKEKDKNKEKGKGN